MQLAPLTTFYPSPAQLQQAARAEATPRDPRIWETAQDFEAQFLSSMLQPMFENIQEEDSPFSGGPGETMFRSLLVDQYGQNIAKSGGVGIADAVYREMIKMQEMPQ